MSDDRSHVGKSYAAETLDQQEAAYDDWASKYEADLCAFGHRNPAVVPTVFAGHVALDTAPILDAGCGGGIQAEPLALLGYGPIVGIDFSAGMLDVARGKGIYAELRQMTLGEHLDFPDDHFGAVLSSGCITPKHAPAHSFDELIRITKPGAVIIFSLRDDPAQEPEYPAALARLEQTGAWTPVFATPSFQSMPYGEPDVTHAVHVYRVA
ncbi:MAG: class I SAM-dependent methyltransferase [Alphaproteobacteria bacterium]|nr:class I SAM-dependent methyltransferase [Alphaproteobacteria bacterium]